MPRVPTAFAVVFAAVSLDAAPIDREAKTRSECVSRDDPIAEIFTDTERTDLDRDWDAVAAPKIHGGKWPSSRRFGLNRVLTTLYSQHSREALPIFEGRTPPPEVLRRFFRCRGFATSVDLDPRLLETVVAAAVRFEAPRVVVVSAYRSPKFNDALAKKGRRVATESKHTEGAAMDFSIPDVPAAEIGAWLWETFDGGVGTYRADGFVHIDVGPKRRWNGI